MEDITGGVFVELTTIMKLIVPANATTKRAVMSGVWGIGMCSWQAGSWRLRCISLASARDQRAAATGSWRLMDLMTVGKELSRTNERLKAY